MAKNFKRRIFRNTWKSREIHISVSENTVLLACSHADSFTVVYGWFCALWKQRRMVLKASSVYCPVLSRRSWPTPEGTHQGWRFSHQSIQFHQKHKTMCVGSTHLSWTSEHISTTAVCTQMWRYLPWAFLHRWRGQRDGSKSTPFL